MTQRVAVTAASGKTGRAVTAALVRRGVDVRALHRPALDLDTGQGLDEGLADCDAIYLLVPNVHPDEPGVVQRVLTVAERADVRYIVYHSVAQPYVPSMPHHVDKAVAEDLVRRWSGEWSVLQPCAYIQNFIPDLREENPKVTAPYSPDTRFNLVDLEDVAEAASVVLTDRQHAGATYELGGPEAVSLRDVVTAAADVLGRAVALRTMSRVQWAQTAGAQLSDDASNRLLAMFAYYDQYGLRAGSLTPGALLGRPPKTMRGVLTQELISPPQ